MDDAERERFAREARKEGLSLSAWFRKAARERVRRPVSLNLQTVEDLEAFFEECAQREGGTEPGWDEHLSVLQESYRRDGPW